MWFRRRKDFVKCSVCGRRLRKVVEGKRFVCWRCADRVVGEGFIKIERLPYPERDPFSLTPSDPSLLIEEVRKGEVELLVRALLDGKVIVVLGDLGSGKTTLCERAYNKLRDRFKMENSGVVPLFLRATTYTTMEDYVQSILRELRLPTPVNKLELVETLVNWPRFHSERLAFIIDDITEAGFWMEVGEFIRLISDVPGMSVAMNGPKKEMYRFMKINRALNDRIQVKITMKPLTKHETRAMLVARAAKALGEAERRLISDDAYWEIAKRSKGNPRMALKLASQAYQLALQLNSPLDGRLVSQFF